MKATALALVPLALALAACESTSRFDGMFGSQPVPVAARPMAPEQGLSAPMAPVSSQPLPPLSGSQGMEQPGLGQTGVAPPPGLDPQPGVGQQPATPPAGTVVVALPKPAAPSAPAARGLAGGWKISDAARGNCGITLTQQTLLDLYRASPSGCQAGSLAKVNAWQQRGQEIVLLEPGGRTAVRLFPKGDGTYEGAATTSGAIIRMSR